MTDSSLIIKWGAVIFDATEISIIWPYVAGGAVDSATDSLIIAAASRCMAFTFPKICFSAALQRKNQRHQTGNSRECNTARVHGPQTHKYLNRVFCCLTFNLRNKIQDSFYNKYGRIFSLWIKHRSWDNSFFFYLDVSNIVFLDHSWHLREIQVVNLWVPHHTSCQLISPSRLVTYTLFVFTTTIIITYYYYNEVN